MPDSPRFPTPPFARVQGEGERESGRYKPAALWYDTTDERLVIFVKGQPVPVTEPVLPGLEIL